MSDEARPGRPRDPIRPVAVATIAYLVAAAIGAVVRGNKEFVFYIAVMVLLCGAILFVHRHVRLSAPLLWCLSSWGLLHMAGGLVPVPESWPIAGEIRVLYSWWLIPERLKYDQVVHAFGFAVTTVLCWQGLRSFAPTVRPRLGPLVLCGAAGMGFGALNEVIEFIAVLLVPETNVGGYRNTGWDLVANLTGCVAAMLLIRLRGFLPRRGH